VTTNPGAILCANEAKSIKLKYPEILELCSNAESGSPIFCYDSLTQKDRKSIGMRLCSNAKSPLPSSCWKQLTSLKGLQKLSEDKIFSFCQEIDDTAPLQCLDYVLTESSLVTGWGGSLTSSQNVLEACQTAMYPLDSYENIDTAIECVSDLRKEIQPSRGMTAQNIITFCFSQLYPTNASQTCYLNTLNSTQVMSILDPHQRLELCHNTESGVAPIRCLEHLLTIKKQGKIGQNLVESSMIELCSGARGIGPADCYAAAKQIQFSELRSSSSSSSSAAASSSDSSQKKSQIQKNMEKVKAARAGAGGGKAKKQSGEQDLLEEQSVPQSTSSSHSSSSPLLSNEEINHQGKLTLCQNAPNDGPARCVRRAIAVFQNIRPSPSDGSESYIPEIHVPVGYDPAVYYSTLLCAGAATDGPAECVTKAPHWLSPEEKIHLCSFSNNPTSTYVATHPLECLSSVSNSISSKRLTNSPKKCFGYFHTSLNFESEKKSRSLLLHMCSYHGSDYPLSAAYCYRTVPTILDHDTAVVSVCTNHSNINHEESSSSPSEGHFNGRQTSSAAPGLKYDPEALSSCTKLLPANWKSEERTLLCGHVDSVKVAEVVVECALDLHSSAKLLSRMEAAILCSNETLDKEPLTKGGKNSPRAVGGVASCMRRVQTDIPSGGSINQLPGKEIQMAVCGKAKTGAAGTCLAGFSSKSKQNILTSEGLIEFCSAPSALSRISCLQHLHSKSRGKSSLSSEEIQYCLEVEPFPEKATVLLFHGSDGSPEAMAGRWFRLQLQLFNQWGQKMVGVNDIKVVASINENNHQGAVLWGTTSNSSVDGRVLLDHLIISQPGPVELKISYLNTNPHSSPPSPSTTFRRRGSGEEVIKSTLLLTRLTVVPNPELAASEKCLFLFSSLLCPVPTSASDTTQWEYSFPNEIGFLSTDHYLKVLSCGSVYELWAVVTSTLPSGETFVQYRYGIDSIWTGKGLPREDMPFHERLEVSETSTDLKEIRRAYHRKSLQWHPDRWSGLTNTLNGLSSELYIIAVQGAFELIAEAYKELTKLITDGMESTE
jgi:hypothetical protein